MTAPNLQQQNAVFTARLQSVEKKLKDQQLQEVATELNQLIKERPRDPRVYLLGAQLAEATGHANGILQSAQKAADLAPTWIVSALFLAAVHVSQGRPEQAMAQAQKAHALNQNTADVLSRLVNIAQTARAYNAALQWLKEWEVLEPENPHVQRALASTYAALKQHAASISIWDKLIAQYPDLLTLRSNRARQHLLLNQVEQAQADAEFLIAREPENPAHQFLLAMTRGETPTHQPPNLVQATFDEYAKTFDKDLVQKLQYRLPQDVANMLLQWYPDKQFHLLDLGCGTGLLGLFLGPINGFMIGVDLSQEMLKKAAVHQVYHRFHHTNIVDAVRETPASLYHVITACDVFIYVGDLAPVIPNAHRILLPGGRLVFSVEALADDDTPEGFRLVPQTLRYLHSRAYLERLLQAAGFAHFEIADYVIRQEGGQPVNGYLVTATKAA